MSKFSRCRSLEDDGHSDLSAVSVSSQWRMSHWDEKRWQESKRKFCPSRQQCTADCGSQSAGILWVLWKTGFVLTLHGKMKDSVGNNCCVDYLPVARVQTFLCYLWEYVRRTVASFTKAICQVTSQFGLFNCVHINHITFKKQYFSFLHFDLLSLAFLCFWKQNLCIEPCIDFFEVL